MAPTRTGKGVGAFQFDRVFPGVGRIKQSSGTTKVKEYEKRNALLTKLYESSSLEVLRAFRDRKITIEDMIEADRSNHPTMSLDRLSLTGSLWDAIKKALPQMGKSVHTRNRYERALKKLRESMDWPAKARVSDLANVDWQALQAQWDGGAADWNHVRRAVSRFLTIHLGDKYHPMRRQIVSKIGEAVETPRTPDQSAELFLRLMKHIPEVAVPCFMTLALAGLRMGEYLGADKTSLRPETKSIRVKGKTGEGVVYLSAEAFLIAQAAIPCPLGPRATPGRHIGDELAYRRMRRLYLAAQKAEGVKGLTLHDIRHLFGQTAADEQISTAETQAQMRHKDPRMTRRYEIPAQARKAAKAVAERLGVQARTPAKRGKK